MGIRGLSTFIKNNDLLDDYDLNDTTILIDGSSLAHELYFTNNQTNHIFGGDLDLFICQIRNFFYGLRKCNVKSIVVIDGSLNPTLEKMNTRLQRLESYVKKTHQIFQNKFHNNQIYPPIANGVFCTQVQNLGVRLFRTAHESEYIICELAKDLHCPVLSNDGDFFIEDLPAGVLYLSALIDNFKIFEKLKEGIADPPRKLTPTSPTRYFQCKIFKLAHFRRILPQYSNINLLPISVAIFDTDRRVSNVILKQIPKIEDCGSRNVRSRQIHSVLQWISRFSSVDNLLKTIIHKYEENDELIEYIRENAEKFKRRDMPTNRKRTIQNDEQIDKYFKENYDRIFLQQLSSEINCPAWLQRLYIDAKINLRFLSIVSLRQDIFKPLVEDFRFKESSAECVYTLNEYIYGMLVRTTANSSDSLPIIHRFCRRGTELANDQVKPRIIIGDEPLPTIDELEELAEERRRHLFFKILDLDPVLFEQMEDLLLAFVEKNDDGFVVNEAYRNKTVLLLLSIVYLMRQFDGQIALEFLYALFTNIMLSGYCNQPEDVPTLFKLDVNHRKYFHLNLARFNEVPDFDASTNLYNPTIVHYYNAYQNCFFSIEFLMEILNLNQPLNVRYFPFSLKGTFIYNLTVELSKQSNPLSHLTENILNRPATHNDDGNEDLPKLEFKPAKLFHDLLQLVLNNSQRKFKFFGSDNKGTVPLETIDLDLGKLSLADSVEEVQEQSKSFITRILDDNTLKNL